MRREKGMSRKHAPIPKGDNELCHPSDADWIPVSSRETKICDLDRAAIVHEEVARLQVAVQNPVRVAMGDGGQELEHERFDFGLQEWGGHDGEERLQVVLDEVHHDEHSVGRGAAEVKPGRNVRVLRSVLGERFSYDNLANSNDVFVSAHHEGVYFAKGGDGEPVLLFIELQLLQGDDVARLFIPSAKDDAVRALLYRVELFVRVHGAGRREGRMVGPWRGEYARGWWWPLERCVER